MEGRRLIREISLKNFLSFGNDSKPIALEPLNVLIGPNASGKSNFLEAFAFLNASSTDLSGFIRKGGGIGEWIWKGSDGVSFANIEVTVEHFWQSSQSPLLRHMILFAHKGQRFEIIDERIENSERNLEEKDVFFFYRFSKGRPVINTVLLDEANIQDKIASSSKDIHRKRTLRREDVDIEQSILAQRKEKDLYPELTYLGAQYKSIRSYRDWNIGRTTEPRKPQSADMPDDFLLEDCSNLGLILNDLMHRGLRQNILEKVKLIFESVEDISIKVHGGTIQLFLHEVGLKQPIPATRLSDGMLRFLCLIAILCHPTPPPLICLEEPEIGMHPDIIPNIAEMLIKAATRTQLIVTTHSESLVSALSEIPESVLVCEQGENGTEIRRQKKEQLKEWLDKYSLGELWRMGEIGGNRW